MDQNDNPVTKRLFVAGLHGDVDSAQLAARFQPFGDVIDVALARSALDGSCRGFAHIGIIIAPSKLKKCLTVYSGTKWKGMQLKVEEAKPDFKARIQKEHKAAELAAASTPADAEKKKRRNRKRGVSEAELADDMNLIDDDNVAKRKGWKRGKYGRPVAVIRIVNPATGKRVFVDPQKYRDNLKKLDHTTRNGRETSATEAVSTFIIPKYSGVKTILEEAIPSPQTPTDRDIAEFRDGDKGDSQDIENEQNESVHEDEAGDLDDEDLSSSREIDGGDEEHAVEEGGYEPMEVEHGEDTFERRISQYSTHKDPLDAVLNAERHKSLSILNDLFGNSSGDQSESSTGKEKQNASFGKQKSSFSKLAERTDLVPDPKVEDQQEDGSKETKPAAVTDTDRRGESTINTNLRALVYGTADQGSSTGVSLFSNPASSIHEPRPADADPDPAILPDTAATQVFGVTFSFRSTWNAGDPQDEQADAESHDGQAEKEVQAKPETSGNAPSWSFAGPSKMFFLHVRNVRLAERSNFDTSLCFARSDSMEEVESKWNERKRELTQEFKRKHKSSVRKVTKQRKSFSRPDR